MEDGLKVTLTETPSEQAVAKAIEQVDIVDATGRSITLKRPGVLAQFRLVELLGDSASNQTYVGMCLPLIYVAAIDGDPVSRITTKIGLEGLIQRLSDEGVTAVAVGVMEHFGKQDPKADEATLKN